MVGIVGLPGSVHHRWQHFASKRDAVAWVEEQWRRTRERNPALGTLETAVISDREARKRRWQDGRRIYESLERP